MTYREKLGLLIFIFGIVVMFSHPSCNLETSSVDPRLVIGGAAVLIGSILFLLRSKHEDSDS